MIHKKINRKIFFTLNIFIISFLFSCDGAFFNHAAKADISFRQPLKVPGTIDTSIVQNFPSFGSISGLTNTVYGLYGWYSYFSEAWRMYNHVDEVGWKVIRVGGVENITDKVMTRLIDSGYEILFTIMSERWDDPGIYVSGDQEATDVNFINAFIAQTDLLLNKYGPGGTFWDSYGSDQSSRIYWEIWNEPNQHYLYSNSTNWNSKTIVEKARVYGRLCKAAYDHIRSNSNWNSVKVVGLSACGVSRNDIWCSTTSDYRGFIQLVHEYVNNPATYPNGSQTGSAEFYDILSVHPYVHNAPPDSQDIPSEWYNYSIANSFDVYRTTMKNFGNGSKPVWFTEVGWHRLNGVFDSNAKPAVSERIQAAYVCRMYLIAMRLGVQRVHIMFLFDADVFNGGFFNYVDSNHPDLITWNESAYAVQTMLDIMPRPQMIDAISDGTDGYYAYEIDPDYASSTEPNVIVAWNVEEPIDVTIPCAAGTYRVINMVGGENVVKSDGSVNVEIGPCPIYLVRK